MSRSSEGFPIGRMVALVFAIFALGLVLYMSGSIVENVDANEICVVQSPFSGKLTWHMEPGVKMQLFGKVTKYEKRTQFEFEKENAIKIRFNDGGHATISGSIAWEMPTNEPNLREIHAKYGVQEGIEGQLIRTVVEKAVYMTGPLMSSKESYAERRNELLHYIVDQVQNGVYETDTETVRTVDPLTNNEKTVTVVKIVEKDGKVSRGDVSPLDQFGIHTFNPSINEIAYDDTVEKQIQSQQQAIMQVQTAIANARQAEQAAITAEKNGQAAAAEAKWKQEVLKAQAVTEAEQKLAVAKLDADGAEQYKRKKLLEAEADAGYKRQVMQANGALDQRLAAWVEVNKAYADAIKGYTGRWVPEVMMSGNGAGNSPSGGNPAMDMFQLVGLKTARDIGLQIADETPTTTKASVPGR